jgi:hypothetical protein
MNSILSAMLAALGRWAGADAGEDVQVDVAGVQFVFEQHQEFFHGAGDAVGFVDDQGVAGFEGGQGGA